MAQTSNMLVDGEESGAEYTIKLNSILQALYSDFTGTTPPLNPVADMLWRDTSTNPPTMRRRNSANTGWALDTAGAVQSFNGRTGEVSLDTDDVFDVLPSKTGNKNRALKLSNTEAGLEWGFYIHSVVVSDAGYTVSNAHQLQNVLIKLTTPPGAPLYITLIADAVPGTTVKVFVTGGISGVSAVEVATASGASILKQWGGTSSIQFMEWVTAICVENSTGNNAVWTVGPLYTVPTDPPDPGGGGE